MKILPKRGRNYVWLVESQAKTGTLQEWAEDVNDGANWAIYVSQPLRLEDNGQGSPALCAVYLRVRRDTEQGVILYTDGFNHDHDYNKATIPIEEET